MTYSYLKKIHSISKIYYVAKYTDTDEKREQLFTEIENLLLPDNMITIYHQNLYSTIEKNIIKKYKEMNEDKYQEEVENSKELPNLIKQIETNKITSEYKYTINTPIYIREIQKSLYIGLNPKKQAINTYILAIKIQKNPTQKKTKQTTKLIIINNENNPHTHL